MYHNFSLQERLSKIIVEKCNFISEYTNNYFPFDNVIELKSDIAREHFFAKYVYFSEIFYESFFIEGYDNEGIRYKINLLCTAGYFYWVHLILCDEIIDNDIQEIKDLNKKILESNLYQEESIKIFASIFQPLDSKFWKLWNIHRNNFNNSVTLNKSHSIELTLDTYETICDGKTAYGKAAIDATYLLSGENNEELYNSMLLSYRLFSIGAQLIDDYQDIIPDIKTGQSNFAIKKLDDLLTSKGLAIEKISNNDLKKYFYIYVADEILELSLNYFEKAHNSLKSFSNVEMWLSHIDLVKRKTQHIESCLREYKKLVISKMFSNKLITYEPTESIDKAVNFIINNQNKNGSWEEVFSNTRVSDIWATSFITMNLSELNLGILEKEKIDACIFLENNKINTFFWGYNCVEIEDTDSTTTALIALKSNGFEVENEHQNWLKSQSKNGGLSTYKNYDKLAYTLNYLFSNLDGWMQNHECVTALAYYYLNKFYPNEKSTKEMGIFLLESYLKNSSLHAYWWTSSIYTFYFIAKTLENGFSMFTRELILNLTREYSSKQNVNGSFLNEYGESNVFFTSMMLDTYCVLSCKEFDNNAKKAYIWLKSQQFDDGSFKGSTILRIPKPYVIDTYSVDYGKTNQSSNLITDDYMRLFSTTMALKAISSYISQNNE